VHCTPLKEVPPGQGREGGSTAVGLDPKNTGEMVAQEDWGSVEDTRRDPDANIYKNMVEGLNMGLVGPHDIACPYQWPSILKGRPLKRRTIIN
jgi:hypothetical protein